MRTVLLCHHDAPLDLEGLSRWLQSFSQLVGIVRITEDSQRKKQRIRRELKRVGPVRFADVLAFRLYYRLVLANRDALWERECLSQLKSRFPERSPKPPVLDTHSPNSDEVKRFLENVQPDITIARCKFLLKESIFSIPTVGTFVMHPGICPEYRNAHGGFWALAEDDIENVGTTLLKIDAGVDTGPVYGYYRYPHNEVDDSHIVIQQRTLFDNLDEVADRLRQVAQGNATPIDTEERESSTWGQPWLSKHLRWKLMAHLRQRRERNA